MSFNARIRKRKSKVNSLISYVLEVVENWRDQKNKGGEPNHRTVAYIGSRQEHFLDVQSNRDKLWIKIELTLKRLLSDGTITEKDAQKIRKRFDEEIPRVKGFTFKPKLRPYPLPARTGLSRTR
jgi:hypothetical protein